MTIDPRIGFWFSVTAALVSGLLLAGAEFTTLFGKQNTDIILAALGVLNVIINALNAVLHAIPSTPPSTPAAASKFLLGPNV